MVYSSPVPRLVLLLLAFGLVVGALPLVWELVDIATTEQSEVVYNGVYEPLRGVEMSRGYESSMNYAFDNQNTGPDWLTLSAFPLLGAMLGAAVGVVLGKQGIVLTRTSQR